MKAWLGCTKRTPHHCACGAGARAEPDHLDLGPRPVKLDLEAATLDDVTIGGCEQTSAGHRQVVQYRLVVWRRIGVVHRPAEDGVAVEETPLDRESDAVAAADARWVFSPDPGAPLEPAVVHRSLVGRSVSILSGRRISVGERGSGGR